MEQDGSGELLVEMSEKDKKRFIDLFQPLKLPPFMIDGGSSWMCLPIHHSMLVDMEAELLARNMSILL